MCLHHHASQILYVARVKINNKKKSNVLLAYWTGSHDEKSSVGQEGHCFFFSYVFVVQLDDNSQWLFEIGFASFLKRTDRLDVV